MFGLAHKPCSVQMTIVDHNQAKASFGRPLQENLDDACKTLNLTKPTKLTATKQTALSIPKSAVSIVVSQTRVVLMMLICPPSARKLTCLKQSVFS